ncbi:hormone-sensitive lipase isoform X2 [Planococcus citri]
MSITVTEIPSERLYESLLKSCVDNKQYFYPLHDSKSQKLYNAFEALEEQIENFLPILNDFRSTAPDYDFKSTPSNGYRSFITAVDKLSSACSKTCKSISDHRSSLFFQKLHYAKEIESYSQVYSSLSACFQLLQFLKASADPGHLFMDKVDVIKDLQQCIDKVNITPFFGRRIGFQYGDASQPIIKTVAIMMTVFSEYYYNEKNFLFCAASCSQFLVNAELRAERMTQIASYRTACADFCKTFWNMSESYIFKKMNILFQPTHFVNKMIELPNEPIKYECGDRNVEIPVPTAHIGLKPLNVRLISAVRRQGMNIDTGPISPTSDYFIFHLHGGGFISQTSESHQVYLKSWTMWTEAPILSVDYSLAPEAPYPRAVEEVLFAYVWSLNNLSSLGTNARKIVFAGDSAGANLCLALTLKCIQLNIRKPDGIFLAYVPTVLQFYPSPSRFLALFDPLLAFGFMMCSIKAYTHTGRKSTYSGIKNFEEPDSETTSLEETDESELKALENSKSESQESITPPSFSDLTPDCEKSTSSETLTDNQQNPEEVPLPAKYKNIIKGFASNLKEKLSSHRNDQTVRSNCHSVKEIDITQLISDAEDDIFISPIKASDSIFKKFPPTSILSVEMDPCLDDCVILAKKLDRLHKKVHLDVLKDLAHGFLNVSLSSKEAFNGSVLCAQRIKELLHGTLPVSK